MINEEDVSLGEWMSGWPKDTMISQPTEPFSTFRLEERCQAWRTLLEEEGYEVLDTFIEKDTTGDPVNKQWAHCTFMVKRVKKMFEQG